MKILFVTPRLPFPPDRGDRLRYFNFARSLSIHHSLSLVSLIQTEEEFKYIEELKSIFDHVETVLLDPWKSNLNMAIHFFSKMPLQVFKFHSEKMQKKINEITNREKFDAIYAFHFRTAHYLKRIKGTYKILDSMDGIGLFLRRMLPKVNIYLKPIILREWVATKEYESKVLKEFDECWFISTVDKNSVKGTSARCNIHIVPNGIDTDYFRPERIGRDSSNLLFVGYMGIESIDAILFFYNNIFPSIREEVPTARFYIVGKDPPRKIIELVEDGNITVTGYVEDLRPYYNSAAVLVAPLRFVVGLQNKVLEAMAMKVPVVTTSLGNEGIFAKYGESIFVEDHPREFAQRVVELLRDKELRDRIGTNARDFVKERFSWSQVVQRMDVLSKDLRKMNSNVRQTSYTR